jgi:hypothetical protein
VVLAAREAGPRLIERTGRLATTFIAQLYVRPVNDLLWRGGDMLFTIALVLLSSWLIGVVGSTTWAPSFTSSCSSAFVAAAGVPSGSRRRRSTFSPWAR